MPPFGVGFGLTPEQILCIPLAPETQDFTL